jgi:tetratricopeptide (TPR) repeat protein
MPVLSFAFPLALYLLTACRDIYWMDSTELALCGRFLLVAHPPGYPLLTLLVRSASLVSAAPLALNLVSALAAAGSCLALFFIVHVLTRDDLSALAAALIWSVSFELWQQATALEVYSLHVMLAGLVLLACLSWRDTGSGRYLLAAGFATGLALANHLTVVLLVPSLLLLVLWPGRRISLRLAFGVALCACLPLALYLVVPLRGYPGRYGGWGGVQSLGELLSFVSGRIYRYRLLSGSDAGMPGGLAALPPLFGRQFLVGWLLVAVGVASLVRRQIRLLAALLGGIVLVSGFALVYNIPDKEGYFLTAYFLCAVLAGVGIHALSSTRLRRAAPVLGLALAAVQLLLHFPRQDRSDHRALSELGRAAAAEIPAGAILLSDDYSLVQALRWLDAEEPLTFEVVSEHHLAFPWYLDWLSTRLPIPAEAKRLASALWSEPQPGGVRFGELASRTVRQAGRKLVWAWRPRRVFWLPKDFGEWPDYREGHRLVTRGLTSEFDAPDSALPVLPGLTALPAPALCRQATGDDYAEDACRRYAAALNRRGILRFARDDAPGAQADFDRALAYYPDYPGAIENKGLVFYLSGEPDSARLYLERFARLDPSSPEMQRVRSLLEGLRR